MSLAETFNQLGQDIMPQVAAAVFPDLMTVYSEGTAKNSKGDNATTRTATATDVPVNYKPNNVKGFNRTIGDKRSVPNEYLLTFPTVKSGVRINVDQNTRFIVAARGLEPAKTFTVKNIGNEQGVIYKVLCELV